MSEICDNCKEKKSMININGSHCYCFECFNKIINNQIDVNFDVVETFEVIEEDGSNHLFDINNYIAFNKSIFEAIEKNGYYHFQFYTGTKDDQQKAEKELLNKIYLGIKNKTIEVNEDCDLSLKEKGVIHISTDKENYYAPSFVIDGKKYSADELANLFVSYEGRNITFQILDNYSHLLGIDEYLMPIKITKESLLEDLENAFYLTTKNKFLSYKNVMIFDTLFYKIIEKLEFLYSNIDYKSAMEIAKEIVKRLSSIDTDDDCFPYNQIEEIRNIVDHDKENEEFNKFLDTLNN